MMRALFIPFLCSFAVLLSACGFTPMHGTSRTAAPLANMDIELKKASNVIDNQAGFLVVQRLRDRVGRRSDAAPYRLEITPIYSRSGFGITGAEIASRYDIRVTAQWDLIDTKTGNSLKTGRNVSTVTFGAPEGPYGVITADNVGIEQSAKETADKVIIELAQYFAAENKK